MGQRDAQQAHDLFGIVEKQLIEIAHPVEQQRVPMTCLQAQVLLHHWRVLVETRIGMRVFWILGDHRHAGRVGKDAIVFERLGGGDAILPAATWTAMA